MAKWISSVVLSLAVVSTLSFPQPDAEYNIPTVGLGSRSQYYVLHSDGTFKYGYDSGDGLYEQSMAQAPGEVSGAFGYKDPTGADIKLEYTADERGFLPRGGHLPIGPESDFGARVRGVPDSSATGSVAIPYTAVSPSPAIPVVPVEVADIRSSVGDDGGYSFSYDTSSSSRSESGDAHNSVTGRYSFIADDGVNRAINYVAGAETGYIAEGDSLPIGPAVPGAESGIPTGRILPILSEEEANALAAATYVAPQTKSAPSVLSSHSAAPRPFHSDVARTKTASSGSRDASYSFSYDAGDSARSESADADLNIQGEYSFVPPEGHRLTVNYVAGSGTGFVASGDHLPVAPDAASGSSASGSAHLATVNVYSAPASSPVIKTQETPAVSVPVEVAQIRSTAGGDGSYNFAYETSSSSRSESGDAQNSVAGEYSFVADDGINRAIKYSANALTGYIAEGDSLPQGPPVPGAESGIPTGRILPILSEEEANALAAATSGSSSLTRTGQAGSATTYTGAAAVTKTASSQSSDASYSFNYDAGDSTRSESADADLNVQGSFSFQPPEGHRLTVNYVAGSDTGFVATGDHLPVAPVAVPASGFDGHTSVSSGTAYSAPSSLSSAVIPAKPSVAAPAEVAQVRSSTDLDGSYSFSYETDSSSRSESADAHNSVTGRYSFVADDGINRRIDYVAGSETGFIAEGDSLPIGPAVPGAESGIPTGRILPVFSEEEANALARASSVSGAVPLLKTSAIRDAAAAPADASYSFSFASDSYSRNEEADADGNIVGSYTYVDEDGNEHTVKFVAGRETGFLPEGYPTPSATGATRVAAPANAAGVTATATGTAAASAYSARAAAETSAGASRSLPAKPLMPSTRSFSSSAGHSSQVVGDVLLHTYSPANREKFGYVYTALRR